ncbi:hypothetical protein DL96DRAFT_1574624 [Flagelloscypha sp. PMI_526]|nr:hypothetical protein DL96DRAFT_1574624 [Flagelloscypha sp. PMI_526]
MTFRKSRHAVPPSRSDLAALNSMHFLSPTLTATELADDLDSHSFVLDDHTQLWHSSMFSKSSVPLSLSAHSSPVSVGTFGQLPQVNGFIEHPEDNSCHIDGPSHPLVVRESVAQVPSPSWISWPSSLSSISVKSETTLSDFGDKTSSLSESTSLATIHSPPSSQTVSPLCLSLAACPSLIRYSINPDPPSQVFPWLKSLQITLNIDQEGFRNASVVFRPSSAVNDFASIGPNGCVHFTPINRQTYPFHHAPMEGRPILRRLIVNNDESQDYLSHLASICLKTNIVYCIRGTENSCQTDYSGRLDWSFTYIVADRRMQNRQIASHGEKTILPMTFSCSPHLLHPSQAKKTTIVQVLKKSFARRIEPILFEPPLSATPKTSSISPEQPTAQYQRCAPRKPAGKENVHPKSSSTAQHSRQILRKSQLVKLMDGDAYPAFSRTENSSGGLAPRPRRKVA